MPSGRAQRLPHDIDQTSRSNSPKGRVVMKQFQGSRTKSAPKVRSRKAQPTTVISISEVPPRRRATSAFPEAAAVDGERPEVHADRGPATSQ